LWAGSALGLCCGFVLACFIVWAGSAHSGAVWMVAALALVLGYGFGLGWEFSAKRPPDSSKQSVRAIADRIFGGGVSAQFPGLAVSTSTRARETKLLQQGNPLGEEYPDVMTQEARRL
jgi:hypothetical protein